MNIFECFDNFENIKCAKNNKRMHDVDDVEPFYNCLKKTKEDKFYKSLTKQFKQYIYADLNDFEGNMRVFRSNISKLSDRDSAYRYFRNSLDDIDEIKNIFEEVDITFQVYKDQISSGERDEETALNEVAENFIDFVRKYFDYEIKLGTFMTAINRKQAITFMRLLD